MLDVARDISKLFDMPESKIVHVKDRAFNDQCVAGPALDVASYSLMKARSSTELLSACDLEC